MESYSRVKEFVSVNGQTSEVPAEVTFRDFSDLAKRRGWTPQFLAEKFKGKIDGPSEFFHRVIQHDKQYADVVITYRSVIEFYRAESSALLVDGAIRLCVCGCARRVYDRKQYAQTACRKRTERERSRTPKSGSEKSNKRKAFSVTFSESGTRVQGGAFRGLKGPSRAS